MDDHLSIKGQEIFIDRSISLSIARSANTFVARWGSSQVVVVKILSPGASLEILTERIDLWESLNHPHILPVFGISQVDVNPICMISQYCRNGNIRQYLAKNPLADRLSMIYEIALGMQYLHANGVIHGSLRPSSILVNDHERPRIGDFGMIEVQTTKNSDAHRYFSPEAWKGTISRPVDVFAYAMSCYEIFTSTPPWGVLSEKHIYQHVVHEGTRPDRPDPDIEARGLTDDIWEIIEESWAKESRLRPNFDIIIRMIQNCSVNQASNAMSPMDMNIEHPSTSRSGSIHSYSSGPPAYDAEFGPPIATVSSRPQSPVRPLVVQRPMLQRQMPQYPQSTSLFAEHQQLYLQPSSNQPYLSQSPDQNPPPVLQMQRAPSDPLSNRPGPSSILTHSGDSGLGPPIVSLPNRSTSATRFRPSVLRATGNARRSILSTSSWDTSLSRPIFEPMRGHHIPEDQEMVYHRSYSSEPPYSPQSIPSIRRKQSSVEQWQQQVLRYDTPPPIPTSATQAWETRSYGSGDGTSTMDGTNAVLLAGALQTEVNSTRKAGAIDSYLIKIQSLASQSNKDARKLVAAGVVPTLIILLKTRAATGEGLEIVLITLGLLAHDSISANTIFRTNITFTLIEICNSSVIDEISTLSIWCLNRICRNTEIADGLLKQNLPRMLLNKGLASSSIVSRQAAWCFGSLIHTDSIADNLAEFGTSGAIVPLVDHLKKVTFSDESSADDICAALYPIARMARSIKLAKILTKAGCIPLLAHHMNRCEDPQILQWSARAVGCFMRPNSGGMAKALLEAGCAFGLARIPSVLPAEEVEPLASFAFAIQRFSSAEWGSGTRKALVDAGVVDALLAALRAAADEPYPQVHIELALAMSFLGDVGGGTIRKEIIDAGGIDILKRLGKEGNPEVNKTCLMAVTSIAGNLWTRNAASAKTAMSHNWSGGCPDYQPLCPYELIEDDTV